MFEIFIFFRVFQPAISMQCSMFGNTSPSAFLRFLFSDTEDHTLGFYLEVRFACQVVKSN